MPIPLVALSSLQSIAETVFSLSNNLNLHVSLRLLISILEHLKAQGPKAIRFSMVSFFETKSIQNVGTVKYK